MIQLQRVYFTSEFCKQYSFRLKVVCDLIEHSLHLSFLFPFWVVAFFLYFFVRIFTPTFVPIFPSRPSRPSLPSIKDKKKFAMSEFHDV